MFYANWILANFNLNLRNWVFMSVHGLLSRNCYCKIILQNTNYFLIVS